MRVRVDTEEGRGGADALPKPEVQKSQVECEHDWRGIDTGVMCFKCGTKALNAAGWREICEEPIEAYWEEAELERAVKGDEGE